MFHTTYKQSKYNIVQEEYHIVQFEKKDHSLNFVYWFNYTKLSKEVKEKQTQF